MSATTPDVRIVAVDTRDDEGAAGARALLTGASEVMRSCASELWGHEDFVRAPDYWWHRLTHAVAYRRHLFVAVRDGAVVGFAFASVPLADNLHLVDDVEVMVRPDARRRGVGTRLLDAVISLARAEGRTTLIGFGPAQLAAEDDPAALRSRTDPIAAAPGSGAGFALARGFEVAQVERYSVLAVPDAPPAPAPVPGYRIESWFGPTPARLLGGVAALWSAFSNDAPVGDVAFGQEAWDAERFAAMEAAAEGIVVRCNSAAIEEASGEVVGMTQLIFTIGKGSSADQGVTQVLGQHRGHGLGLSLKRANLLAGKAAWPGLRRVHTWNAGENDHMWRINELVGFCTAGAEVCWQRVL